MQTSQLHCPSKAHKDIPCVSLFYFTATDLHSWWTEHPMHPLHTCYGFVVYITHFPVVKSGNITIQCISSITFERVCCLHTVYRQPNCFEYNFK